MSDKHPSWRSLVPPEWFAKADKLPGKAGVLARLVHGHFGDGERRAIIMGEEGLADGYTLTIREVRAALRELTAAGLIAIERLHRRRIEFTLLTGEEE